MIYIKYTVTMKDGKNIELARSYKNDSKHPPCPYLWKLQDANIKYVRAESCDFKEKNKIYRRNDHVFLEPLITRLEELS